MSDIREQIRKIVFDCRHSKKTNVGKAVDEIFALYPRWQSFEEAKPEVGEEVLMRQKNANWWVSKTYWEHDLPTYILMGHQWLRIPE